MTNAQFYTGIAIPSILIILAWMHQNARISRLETTTDKGFADARESDKRILGEGGALRDIVYKQMIDVHERVTRVEERTK